jgi:AcrR family transcriptional regulator
MDDVAREAGVGVGTVYRHFPHKEALLGELVAQKFRAFGDNAERALEVEDPWEAFAGLLRANAELCVRDIGVQEALSRTPEAWRLADAEFQRLDALANQLVARAQAAGVLRRDFAVAEIPMLMSGLYSTMAVSGYDWHRHLEIILDGLRA